MSQPFVGEVRLVGFNFGPAGWMICAGQQLPISEYSTLFNLIGTTYGGDGQQTFNLPDLRGRTPGHQGSSGGSTYVIGQTGGAETVTLNLNQYPRHNHLLMASSNNGTLNTPTNNAAGGLNAYSGITPADAMNSNMLLPSPGNSLPHDNMQPYQVINWVISLFGVYPSQS
ncbi:MAG: tail fiber protein [Bryobacteraceae bacterium]